MFLILPAAQKAGVGVLDPSLRGLYPRAKAHAPPDQAPPRPRPQSPLRTSARSRFASRVPARVGPPTWSRYCRTRFRSRSRFMAARPGSPTERRPPPRRVPSFPRPTEPARSPLSSRPTPRTARNLPLPARPRPGSPSQTRPLWRQNRGSHRWFRDVPLALGLRAVGGPWTPFLPTQGSWSRGASLCPCAVHSYARSGGGREALRAGRGAAADGLGA